MRIKNNDKTYFRAVCIVLFSLAFTGCTKDGLNEFGPGNATGKVVMVSLNVSLPPIEEPSQSYWSENNVRQLPEFPMARQNYTISGFSSLMRMVP